MRYWTQLTLATALLCSGAVQADTTITYQGRLDSSGQPHNGTPNLDFRLFDSAAGGSLLGEVNHLNVPVSDGLFQVDLDFGDVFGGGQRWLEVRVNGLPLEPRQAIRAAPVATYALAGNEGPQGPPGPTGSANVQFFVFENVTITAGSTVSFPGMLTGTDSSVAFIGTYQVGSGVRNALPYRHPTIDRTMELYRQGNNLVVRANFTETLPVRFRFTIIRP